MGSLLLRRRYSLDNHAKRLTSAKSVSVLFFVNFRGVASTYAVSCTQYMESFHFPDSPLFHVCLLPARLAVFRSESSSVDAIQTFPIQCLPMLTICQWNSTRVNYGA